MTSLSLRVRQRVLRWYELGLCAALLGMVAAVALPSPESEAADVQCGKNQSSTAVMHR
jgi:hypothetical protein